MGILSTIDDQVEVRLQEQNLCIWLDAIQSNVICDNCNWWRNPNDFISAKRDYARASINHYRNFGRNLQNAILESSSDEIKQIRRFLLLQMEFDKFRPCSLCKSKYKPNTLNCVEEVQELIHSILTNRKEHVKFYC